MASIGIIHLLVLVASCVGAAMLGLLGACRMTARRPIRLAENLAEADLCIFLFRNNTLLDATQPARRLLADAPRASGDWSRFLALISKRFPEALSKLEKLPELGHIKLFAVDRDMELEAELLNDVTRIVLNRTEPNKPKQVDPLAISSLTDELTTLRQVVDDAPILTWREDMTGAVTWANGAYVRLAEDLRGDGPALAWPLPRLFESSLSAVNQTDGTRRVSARGADGKTLIWFECMTQRIGGEALVFAIPADRLVKAEDSLREFIRTLTQTFAHLPTGLAVFDHTRRLALFNPALTDLSDLEADFLSSRPTLPAFLDRLREKRRMPEPKNYKSWRKRISDLEQAAANGTHQETWTLPSGQTYRVTGRPHPGGAVAFLFEDISAEISLTRRFRSELELGQAVVDSLDEAIAVFSPAGTLTLSNNKYQQLWGTDPTAALGELNIVEATRNWQSVCDPSPVWGEARDFVSGGGERSDWTAEVTMQDGRNLTLRFQPIGGGATMIAFRSNTLQLVSANTPALVR